MDIAWGLGFVLVAIVAYLQNFPSWPKLVLLAMISAWGLRLAFYIFFRSRGHGEDPRYQKYKDLWGKNYVKEGYLKVFMAQGVMMFIISLPIQLGMSRDMDHFGKWQILGFLIWLLGFSLESWADWHLKRFKEDSQNKGKICMSGPWTIVRFPNYLGEMLVWWGVYFYIFSFWTAWTIVSPVAIMASLLKVTGIPLIEEKYMQRAEYRDYAARVSRLMPFLKPRS
jgi:steroid 5-alpha reductase family enzyme